MKKLFGVAVNDSKISGPTVTKRDATGKKSLLPDYAAWYFMLMRCFDVKTKSKDPSCFLSTCCDEWLLRSNFKYWFDLQPYHFDSKGRRLCLDKDILVSGNKNYNPLRCCLVPDYINSIFNEGINSSDSLPLWVRKVTGRNLSKEYRCLVSYKGEKSKHFGYFHTPYEAHREGQLRKCEDILYTLDQRYRKDKTFQDKVYKSIISRVDTIQSEFDLGLISDHI